MCLEILKTSIQDIIRKLIVEFMLAAIISSKDNMMQSFCVWNFYN